MMSWRHVRVFVIFLVIFFAGLIAGVAITAGWVHRQTVALRNPQVWTPRTIAWLRKELKLTPQQVDAIRPTVEKAMAEVESSQRIARTQTGRTASRMLDEITPSLTPEQQELFKEVRKKRTAAWLRQDFTK